MGSKSAIHLIKGLLGWRVRKGLRGKVRFFLSIIALVLASAAAQAAENVEDSPPEPLRRAPPDYPAACAPPPGEPAAPQSVVVMFGVTKDGLTENVRARESTDPCFEEAAVAAVRGWRYEPRRVNGAARPQEDLETTITFVLHEATEVEDFDAAPILRVPPQYPEHCANRAESFEAVFVEFDVTKEGTTENIRTVESTNSCFEKAAESAVAKWRYRPKIVSGTPVERKGVQTQITFELTDGTPSPDMRVRSAVRSRLLRVKKSLRRHEDPQKILAELAEIETQYGDSFSRAELAAFHHFRTAARIEAGDYAGALDDLRVVRRIGMAGESMEAIDRTIMQLEAALAAPVSGGEPAPEDDEQPQ